MAPLHCVTQFVAVETSSPLQLTARRYKIMMLLRITISLMGGSGLFPDLRIFALVLGEPDPLVIEDRTCLSISGSGDLDSSSDRTRVWDERCIST